MTAIHSRVSMFRRSKMPMSKQKSIQSFARNDSLDPSILESNPKGNFERQNTIIKDFDITRISSLTQKCDERYDAEQRLKKKRIVSNPRKTKSNKASSLHDESMNFKKSQMKMGWSFLSQNKKVVTTDDEQLLGFDPTKEVYEHYTEVPSTNEIYRFLLNANRARRLFAASKKSEFDKFQDERRETWNITISELAEKEKAAKIRKTERLSSRRAKDNEIQKMVDIVRKPTHEKTKMECMTVRDWILKKSRRDSVIYTFLKQLQEDPEGDTEALTFVRGLKYQLFNRDEAIIRQNATGYAYFILLSGRVKVYVNRHLWSDEIANERAEGRLGIGQLVDTCDPGADFGEYALITKERRTASVISDRTSECLVVLRDQFKECLAAHTERQVSVMVEQAKKSTYLFSKVGYNVNVDKFIRTLFNRFSRVTVDTDTMLQVQGKKVKVVTLLIKGHCREFVSIKQGVEGRGPKIGLISEFDDSAQNAIGAEYVMQNKKCKTSVVCTTQCELLVISGAQFMKSITESMRERIKEVGDQKASFVRQRIESLKAVNLQPDLSRPTNQMSNRTFASTNQNEDFIENENLTQSAMDRENLFSLRSRHGKWGEQEIKHIDDMLQRNSMIEEAGNQTDKLSDNESSDDITDHFNPRYDGIDPHLTDKLAKGSRKENHETSSVSTKTKKTLVSVPSIEKIAIRIRPLPQKVRRNVHCKQQRSKQHRIRNSKMKKIRKTQSLPSLQRSIGNLHRNPNHQIAMDLVSEKTKRKHRGELNRFNDLMPSNFYNVSDSKQTQKYLYGRLLKALQRKQIEKEGDNPKVAKINMKLLSKTTKTKTHVFGALTPKRAKSPSLSSMMGKRHGSLPCISARKSSNDSKSTTSDRKLRVSNKNSMLKKRKSKTRSHGKSRKSVTKRKGKKCGRSETVSHSNLQQIEETQATEAEDIADIDFERFQHWIDNKSLQNEIRHLQHRHNTHLVTSYDELLQKLSRTGACVDHLVKYHANTNADLYKTNSKRKW